MFDRKRPDPIRERARNEMDNHIRRQIEAMREYNRIRREEERKKSEG